MPFGLKWAELDPETGRTVTKTIGFATLDECDHFAAYVSTWPEFRGFRSVWAPK